ncbi:MAG: MlaD family protein [Flavobacteriales bacterium]
MKFKREILVGIVVVVGIAGLIVGSFYLKGMNIFKDSRKYFAEFDNADGLVASNPVIYRGMKVGVVTKVALDEIKAEIVTVEFIIDNSGLDIPEDSRAILSSYDLLGTKAIEIGLGKSPTLALSGSRLKSDRDPDLKEQVNERLKPLEEKTKSLISKIDSLVGTVEAIFTNNLSNLDESFDGIKSAIVTFEKTARRLDTLVAAQKSNISDIFVKVQSITSNIQASNAEITATLKNAKNISDSIVAADLAGTIRSARSAINEVNDLLFEINNGSGSLTQILKDSTMVNNVNKMIDETSSLINNIKSHPNRYLQFAVFAGKEKGLKLDSKDEKALKKMLREYKSSTITNPD